MNLHLNRKSSDEFNEASKCTSQPRPTRGAKAPHILIIGAGISGLFLAIVLDRSGIPYRIFERGSSVKETGFVASLDRQIHPVLQQLGFYEELKAISSPLLKMHMCYGTTKMIGTLTPENSKELIGHDCLMLPRPRLLEFLLSKVSAERIHFRKKVLSTVQNNEGVVIQCADGTTYQGDILIGADGTNSTVRESLYRNLSDNHHLPPLDAKEMNKRYTCVFATTDPLDPERYPYVAQNHTESYMVIEEGTRYTWSIANVPDNRICSLIIRQLSAQRKRGEEKLHDDRWMSAQNATMINRIRKFKTPWGGTMSDLIHETPKDKISCLQLENRHFETWSHGRTVLIGHAAHKLLPSAAQDTISALQDAVILANCLYSLENSKQESIEAALKDYQEQRYRQVKTQVNNSSRSAFLLHGQTLVERMVRSVVFNWLPHNMKIRAIVAFSSSLSAKDTPYQPQIGLLPQAERREEM